MLLFQSSGETEDRNAWFIDRNGYKKGEKAIPGALDFVIQKSPEALLRWFTSGYPKSAKVLSHYLTANGEDFKVSLSAPEWQLIVHETRAPPGALSYDLQKYETFSFQSKRYKDEGAEEYAGSNYVKFRKDMLDKGYNLDKIESSLKVGERMEMPVKWKNGNTTTYIAEKKKDERLGEYLIVHVDRRWRPSDDGWERMDMVPGGKNSANSSAPFTDSWNILGFTRVARRKVAPEEAGNAPKGAAYIYKVEEIFDFSGSRSSNGGLYSRMTGKLTAKAIKKAYPKAVSIEEMGGGRWNVVVNSDWIESVGKPFKLDIPPVYVNKYGGVIGEVPKQAMPKPMAR